MAFKEPTKNQLRKLLVAHLNADLSEDVKQALQPNQRLEIVNCILRFFDGSIKFKTTKSLVQEESDPNSFLDALDKL